jgi:exodeoxyribonuclease VII large subunit
VRVQGAEAAQEIANAIKAFNREGRADILVVGRGGGSLEDLWPFNEEIVARAIYDSKIPVVSAVGHEVDFTISDLVADLRAPTPSAAMELILPNREDVADHITALKKRLATRRTEHLRHLRGRLQILAQHWAFRTPANLVFMASQRLDELRGRMGSALEHTLSDKQTRVSHQRDLLALLNPQSILDRGYACVRDANGHVVRDALLLKRGDKLALAFAKGSAQAEVLDTSEKGLLDEPT